METYIRHKPIIYAGIYCVRYHPPNGFQRTTDALVSVSGHASESIQETAY